MAGELEAWAEGVEVERLPARMCDVCPDNDPHEARNVVRVTVWLGGSGQTIERAVCWACKEPTVTAFQGLVDKTLETGDAK